MFKPLHCRIVAIAILGLLRGTASQAQSFGEAGSYGTRPSGSGNVEANTNLATGRIAPSIPLLTLPGVAGGVTVGLQYQTGAGIQVNATASEIGLGWAISGGGAIVRDVRGFPDDSEFGWIIDISATSDPYKIRYSFPFAPWMKPLPLSTAGDAVRYFKTTYRATVPSGGGYDYGANETTNLLSWLYPASQVASYGQYSYLNSYTPYGQPNSAGTYEARYSGVFAPDNEPDVYTLALPAGTLQFVFDPSGNPVTLQAQNIKIEALNLRTRTYNANGILHEFLVTTSDGVKYYFGSEATSTGYKEHVTVSTRVLEISGLGSKKDPLPYINKWHLRQILYPSGETIDYTYSPNQNYEVSTNNYLQQDWVFTALDGARFYNCYSCLDIAHAWKKRDWQRRYTIRTTITSTDTKQLASITSAQGSLQFSYQAAARKDIGGTTKALSGVRLLNTHGDLVRRLDLVQHYADYGQTVQNAMTYDRYHLLLDRIVDRGAGCDYTNLWQFGYNQNTFCRNAATKDYWGYLNGLTYPSDGNLVASYATPAASTNSYALPGRIRTPSLSFTQYMILQSITSAAGSVQSFDYQLNDDNSGIGASARNIGGLRIYRISKYDGISHTNDVVDEFTYRKAADANQSSGTTGDWGMYEKLQLIHEDYDRGSSALPIPPDLTDAGLEPVMHYWYAWRA